MTGRDGRLGVPGRAPETTSGSEAVRAVASCRRIAAEPPRPRRGAVSERRARCAHCGHGVDEETSLIGMETSNGPQSAHRNSYSGIGIAFRPSVHRP